MKIITKISNYLFVIIFIFGLIGSSYSHLCDNVFRQQDKLIVKPETYNLIVKDKIKFKIFLQNNMDRGIAEISLIPLSSQFNFIVTPERMSIPKDQRVFFEITMWPKDNIKAGNYPVSFSLVGAGRQFKTFTLNSTDSSNKTIQGPKISSGGLKLKRCPTPLLVEGLLNDSSWKNSAVATNFSLLNGGKPKFETIAILNYNDIDLNIGIYCIDNSTNTLTKKDKVEILLSPIKAPCTFYTLTVNATGNAVFTKKIENGPMVNIMSKSVRFAIAKDKKAWAVETAIPFNAIGLAKAPDNSKWLLKITRVKSNTDPETSFWACDNTGYNDPDGLGQIIFP